MSSQGVKFWSIVWNQFLLKLKANTDMLTGLAIFQVIALIFSFGGNGSFNYGSGVEFNIYTSDLIVIFTMIWLIVIGVQVLRPAGALMTYSMIANRKVDHLSNIIWLIVMTGIATVAVLLANVLLQLITSYFSGGVSLLPEVQLSIGEYVVGVCTIGLYLLLASACGYFLGVLSQWNELVKVFIPILLIGALLIVPNMVSEGVIINVFTFIFLDELFLLFALKILIVTGLLFFMSMRMGNRLEVRK
ncbi:MAG TPA: hypothetical protein VK144_00445 [Bacillota bacterium]|nr:hypothetical protein [Bacillota bacterium]